MFDAAAALLALALLVFEPNIVAHGSLVTTDIASALFLFATVYTFYRYVKRPSTVCLLLVGLMAGLLLASKDSGVLGFPVLLALAIMEVAWPTGRAAQETASDRLRRALRLAAAILCTGALAVAVLWLSYGFRYQARPASRVLIPSLSEYAAQLDHPWETQTLLALGRYHLLPEAYLFGWADTLNTQGHISSYLFGTVYRESVWFYFPAVFVVKSTIGFLLLLILVPIAMWLHGSSLRREMLFLALPPPGLFPIRHGLEIQYWRAALAANLPFSDSACRVCCVRAGPNGPAVAAICGRRCGTARGVLGSCLSQLHRLCQRGLGRPGPLVQGSVRFERGLGAAAERNEQVSGRPGNQGLLVRLF